MKKRTQYVGTAGQLAVMAEFAARGYNVAMPEIDYGDDVFVTLQDTAKIWRIQVKTATPTAKNTTVKKPRSERYQLAVGETFLNDKDDNPPVYIVFCLRFSNIWRFLIIPRARLAEYHKDHQIGQQSGDNIKFDVAIHYEGTAKGKILCGGQELTRWEQEWSPWPKQAFA